MARKKKTAEEYNEEWGGKVFGDVRIDEYSHNDKHGNTFFYCTCLRCGVKFGPVHLGNVKSGHTTSCGNCSERTEIGNRYGHWIVKEFHHRGENGRLYFLCECDCENNGVVRLADLRTGKTTSCGCITESIGETNIKNILDKNNIPYECQKRFEDCKDIKTLPFDFCVMHNDLKWCIEFDGMQHEKPVELYGGEEGFKDTQRRDQIKNQYCEDNNIPLIRIPYSKRDTMTIDDLMLDSSNYLWVKL